MIYSKLTIILFCCVSLFLTACTVSHTKQRLQEAQQLVGLKSDNQIKRWRNIQFDQNRQVLIQSQSTNPAWKNYTQEIHRQAVIACNKHFAKCASSLKTAGYVIDLEIQEVTMTEPNPESAIPVQVKTLSWLATVKDANNQQVLDKLSGTVKKSIIHRETYNFGDLVKPSINDLFKELSNE